MTVLYLYHFDRVWDLTMPTERCVSPDEMTRLGKTLPPRDYGVQITVFSRDRDLMEGANDLDSVLDRIDAQELTLEQGQLVVHCVGCRDDEGDRPTCLYCGEELTCAAHIDQSYWRRHYWLPSPQV